VFTDAVLLTLPSESTHESFYGSNALEVIPPHEVVMEDFPAVQAPTCGLAGGLHCTLPLGGSIESIRFHLCMHGHSHPQRQVVQCPWVGCSDTLRWMNIPRHIRSIHLGVRFRCLNCGKAYTRPRGLAMHTASLECYGQCLFCIEKQTHQISFSHYTRVAVEDRGEPTHTVPGLGSLFLLSVAIMMYICVR